MKQIWVGHEAEVWQSALRVSDTRLRELRSFLSPEEIARARTYGTPKPSKRFIVRRGLLRELLASRLEISPSAVELDLGPRGKSHITGLRFCVSSSQDHVAFALSEQHEVGIDIEVLDKRFAYEVTLRDHFLAEERKAISDSGDFFRVWVRREATLKALGVTSPLQELKPFPVTIDKVRVGGRQLLVSDLDLGPGLAGAVAVAAS